MKIISQDNHNKGKSYKFSHDANFIILFDICNEEVTMQHRAV